MRSFWIAISPSESEFAACPVSPVSCLWNDWKWEGLDCVVIPGWDVVLGVGVVDVDSGVPDEDGFRACCFCGFSRCENHVEACGRGGISSEGYLASWTMR